MRQGHQRYVEKNREKWLQRSRDYTKCNPDKIQNITRSRALDPEKRAKFMWAQVKKRAKSGDFDITLEWVRERIYNGKCEVTGIPFQLTYGQGVVPWCPSIDRIDSSRGYTMDNCRMVVVILNLAKNKFTDDDVMTLAQALTERKK
mgnify:CR=1 FL=1